MQTTDNLLELITGPAVLHDMIDLMRANSKEFRDDEQRYLTHVPLNVNRCLLLHRIRYVGIHIQSGSRRLMSDDCRQTLHIHSMLQCLRCKGAAQIVEDTP